MEKFPSRIFSALGFKQTAKDTETGEMLVQWKANALRSVQDLFIQAREIQQMYSYKKIFHQFYTENDFKNF